MPVVSVAKAFANLESLQARARRLKDHKEVLQLVGKCLRAQDSGMDYRHTMNILFIPGYKTTVCTEHRDAWLSPGPEKALSCLWAPILTFVLQVGNSHAPVALSVASKLADVLFCHACRALTAGSAPTTLAAHLLAPAQGAVLGQSTVLATGAFQRDLPGLTSTHTHLVQPPPPFLQAPRRG